MVKIAWYTSLLCTIVIFLGGCAKLFNLDNFYGDDTVDKIIKDNNKGTSFIEIETGQILDMAPKLMLKLNGVERELDEKGGDNFFKLSTGSGPALAVVTVLNANLYESIKWYNGKALLDTGVTGVEGIFIAYTVSNPFNIPGLYDITAVGITEDAPYSTSFEILVE